MIADDCIVAPSATVEDCDLLSIADVVAATGVSRQTVHGWIQRGHLPIATDDGPAHFKRADVRRLQELRRHASSSNMRMATIRQWLETKDAHRPH